MPYILTPSTGAEYMLLAVLMLIRVNLSVSHCEQNSQPMYQVASTFASPIGIYRLLQ